MSNAQILVVEDESIIAKGIQNDLRNLGYAVPVVAASGEEALEKAAETYPDLVLMDIVLKGNMDGIETSKKMREQFHIPIIYLTAYEDDVTLRRAKVTEPFGYLLKPYEERELHTTIEMALYKHRMERKLKETEQWLTATLKSISDGVIATDARQCIKFINPVAERLTGWGRGEAYGKALPDVFLFQNELTYALIESTSRKAFKKGAPVELPPGCTLVSRDGIQTRVDGTVASILDEDGFYSGFVWVVRDISERLRAEEARHRAEEQQRQAQKMEAIGRLAGGMAHDFNNLLTVILGNVSWMLSALPATDGNRDSLVAAETAALRAAELVKQLRCFSGKTLPRLEPIPLNTQIQEFLIVFRQISDARITIDFTPAADLWPVQADPAQVDEVLMNLCLNAREAMPNGGHLQLETLNVVIDPAYLESHQQAHLGDYVCLRVSDTGRGILPEILPRIFEPYFTTKESERGSGLGLALVFGIVEQHQGWIDCASEVDEGTHLEVYLPRYWQETGTPAAPRVAKAPRTGPKTILLADDEPMIRELGQAILQDCGYEVLLAKDGVEAVEIYQRERGRIDLVILDLTMPRMSGSDAFRQLVQFDPDVHVLFSSGYFAEDMMASDEHVLGFIDKPYRRDDLANTIRSALDQIGPSQEKSFWNGEGESE